MPVSNVMVTTCELHRIPVTDFAELIASNAAFARHWLELQSLEHLAQLRRAADLRCLPALARLEQLLRRMAKLWGEGEILRLPVKHQELADLLAVTPEYLSRFLGRLEREGLLRREGGCIHLPRSGRLRPGANDDAFEEVFFDLLI